MSKKSGYLITLLLISILLIPSLASANRGMIVPGPREIYLEETGQNAIVAWNGEEEVIILSTDAKSSESTLVLEVIPLPSNPTKVEEGSFDSFTKLSEIVNKKVRAMRKGIGRPLGLSMEVVTPGVEITFHKKIGAHDVTIVKVNDLDYFLNWVEDFIINKGFEYTEISSEFKNSVTNYLNKDIKFFVFDVIETAKDRQSIKPLIYRFKTDFLYYPLEITATSDAGGSISEVNILLIAKGIIDESIVSNVNLWPTTGFDYNIELSKNELKEISPELADLFKSNPLVMNAYYYGILGSLNQDLVVYKQNIYIPTFFEKVSQRVSLVILLVPAFQYLTSLLEDFKTEELMATRVLVAIVLLSFIAGILSIFFIIVRLIKRLLGKFNLKSIGYNLLSYIISAIIVIFFLSRDLGLLTTFIFMILTVLGFAMMVLLIMKLFKNIFQT